MEASTFRNRLLVFGCLLVTSTVAKSQGGLLSGGQIHGNFQIDAQYYQLDSAIQAFPPQDKMRMNAFGNIIYTNGNFTAGARYEAYHNALLGFPTGYTGTGIPYRFAQYKHDQFDITVGSFYEQFGSGLIFRSYEERLLGYDNAMDGVRFNFNPYKGVYLKTVYGTQRLFFTKGPGIVRGIDGEINLNELFDSARADKKLNVIVGGSFVSKYQDPTDPTYVFPANVGSWSGRINIVKGTFNWFTEAAYKINDPSLDNGYIYKPGEALFTQLSYAKKGIGFNIAAKYIDNMSYRSDRKENLTNLMINFLPSLSKPHTYNLAATLYPYATQPNGEFSAQGEVLFKFKSGTPLGGKYGTTIALNYSMANNLDTTQLNDEAGARLGYEAKRLMWGKNALFKDHNIEIRKKLSDKFKFILTYIYFLYDIEIVQGKIGKPDVHAHIGVADLNYKIDKKNNLRVELQHMFTEQDQQSWATAIVEYSISPHWFFAVMDQYNYGNKIEKDRLHYPYATVGLTRGPNRIALGYGKQRAGLFCVGGVCRPVPASNGLTINITSSF